LFSVTGGETTRGKEEVRRGEVLGNNGRYGTTHHEFKASVMTKKFRSFCWSLIGNGEEEERLVRMGTLRDMGREEERRRLT
jgi:hypothetical protein